MKLVIDIPDELYRQVKDPSVEGGYIATECYNAIYRGIPLDRFLEAYNSRDEELDFVQPHKKVSVNLEVCKMREATREEREGVEQYIDSISEPTGVDFSDLLKKDEEEWIDECFDKLYNAPTVDDKPQGEDKLNIDAIKEYIRCAAVIYHDNANTIKENVQHETDPEYGKAQLSELCSKRCYQIVEWLEELKQYKEQEGMSKKNCPICDYPFDMCQCPFSGSAHPDRSKRARVVADHIYLLSDEQIEHLKRVQKWWHIEYVDEEMKQILAELESEG